MKWFSYKKISKISYANCYHFVSASVCWTDTYDVFMTPLFPLHVLHFPNVTSFTIDVCFCRQEWIIDNNASRQKTDCFMTCNVEPYYTWIVWTRMQPVKYDYGYICDILSAEVISRDIRKLDQYQITQTRVHDIICGGQHQCSVVKMPILPIAKKKPRD